MKEQTFSTELNGKEIIVKTGKLAQQANGSCTVQIGDTIVLGTAVISDDIRPGIDFLPLMVDYEEKLYAAGKIKGSRFVKREGRPTDEAVVTSRLIDRGIRPLFNKNIRHDIQVIATVLSYDGEHDADIASMLAASVALQISDIPFDGPLSGVRVGKIDGKLAANPTKSELKNSTLDLVVSGKEDRTLMVEAGAQELSEADMLEAIKFAHEQINKLNEFQLEIAKKIGKPKKEAPLSEDHAELKAKVADMVGSTFDDAMSDKDRFKSNEILAAKRTEVADKIKESTEDEQNVDSVVSSAKEVFDKLWETHMRSSILEKGSRLAGRKPEEIRQLTIEAGLFPRTHGSALFQRGDTQAVTIATLGSPSMEQILDGMELEVKKRYMHHYNFPPFSTGEARPMRSPGRREIGHGALAERALLPVLPTAEKFAYTIRLVTEIMSSSGSTSMAATCGSTLALMDAGVPISKPVAGIAMGLITDPEDRDKKFQVLTDLQDAEDFMGDMDFKITGTADGITAMQMDTKIQGLSMGVVEKTLEQALKGRTEILGAMKKVIAEPRAEMSQYAPKLESFKIDPEKIRVVIGKGGEMINKIIDETKVEIDIDDDGMVSIASTEDGDIKRAMEWIKTLTTDPKPGDKFKGKITRLMDFGAFAEIVPGKEGLIHISQLSEEHIQHPGDVVKVGDEIEVEVTEIDDMGRLNLSHLKAIGKAAPERSRGGSRGGGGRGFGGHGGRGGGRPFDRGGRGGSRGGGQRQRY